MDRVLNPRHILITGIAGNIGRCIAPVLAARGHTVTGFDTRAHPDFPTTLGNITDIDLLRAAMAGIDTVIHLAALPYDADFQKYLLQPNVVGMVNVCQLAAAASASGAPIRLILASTVQVHYGHSDLQLQRPLTVADGPAPTNFYALTKTWAEETGRMLARTHPHLTVLAARIGGFDLGEKTIRRMVQTSTTHLYLSHADTRRFFIAAVECPPPPDRFAVVFCFSKPALATVDLPDTQRLIGYVPLDDFPSA